MIKELFLNQNLTENLPQEYINTIQTPFNTVINDQRKQSTCQLNLQTRQSNKEEARVRMCLYRANLTRVKVASTP